MLDRLVKPKDLADRSLEERIDFIQEKIGLSDEDIENIQTHKSKELNHNTYDTIIEASEIIYSVMKEQGHSKQFSLTHLTGSIIAPLILKEENHRKSTSIINNIILKNLKSEREELSKTYNCKISTPTILRKNIFEQIEGKPFLINAEESKKIYGPKVKFSDFDLLRGIKLPKLGIKEGILMGLLTSAGALEYHSAKRTHKIVFGFSKQRDNEFYMETIYPIIQNSFQIYTEQSQKEKEFMRRIEINSSAAYSLFKDYLGMSHTLKNRRLIDFSKLPSTIFKEDKHDVQKAYFSGILAGKFRINTYNGKYQAQGGINNQENPQLLKDIQKLASKYEIQSKLVNNNTRLAFSIKSTEKILKDTFYKNKKIDFTYKGLLINNYEINKLK